MRFFVLIIALLFSFPVMSSWHNKTISDNGNSMIYVGISGFHENLSDAMSEAYNNAIKEAIKHNFGFNQKMQENFYISLENTEIQQNSFINLQSIQIKGVKPELFLVKENNDKYMVYRQVSYNKKEIQKEKDRLKNISKKTDFNLYNNSGAKGFLNIETIPNQAQVQIVSEDGDFNINGMSNGRFNLPLGKYNIIVNKKGYKPEQRKIIITSNNSLSLNLSPAKATIRVFTQPSDAQVFLNGRKLLNNEIDILANEIYSLRVEHYDYFHKEESFQVEENRIQDINVKLIPKKSKLSIYSSPSNAQVLIDGEFLGNTPFINKRVNSGRREIIIKKNNYKPIRKEIVLKPNKSLKPLSFELEFIQDDIKDKVLSKSKKESVFFINMSNFENPLINDLETYQIYNNYKKENLLMWSFGYNSNINQYNHFYWEIGYELSSTNFGNDINSGEFKDSFSHLYFGFPVKLFNKRLTIKPLLGIYSFEHEGVNKSDTWNIGATDSFKISGQLLSYSVHWDMIRFNKDNKKNISLDIFYKSYQFLNQSVNIDSEVFNYDLEIQDTSSIGVGINFYY